MVIGILLIVVGIILLCYFVTKPYFYWAKKNVLTGPVIPIFGENLRVCFGKESPAELIQRIYNKLQGVRYVGIYQFHVPVLVLKCPKLIKELCVKNSEYFLDHTDLILASGDELWTRCLSALKGQEWKDMRAVVSPTFTSSKMKMMFASISQHAQTFTQHFLDQKEEIVEGEFRDAYTRYCNDIIASNAFGVQIDSLKDRENEFYLMAYDACDFTTSWKKFVLFLYQLLPAVAKLFRASIFGRQVKKYFLALVKDSIKVRQENNIKCPDVIGLLMEAREGGDEELVEEEADHLLTLEDRKRVQTLKKTISDTDIAAQAFVIFIGAFETGSITMCFMAYELAVNPDVQKKLIQEIDEHRNMDGSISYDTILKLPYMDMVFCEVLRKWPGSVAISRVARKAYTIEPKLPHERPLQLDKNSNVMIPILGIHRDAKYFKYPDKFDPERFSPENVTKIEPYTYLPFGVGPRYCIGKRFGILAVKSLFFYLLSSFEIVPIKDTPIPLIISRNSMNLTSENGFPLGLKRRKC